MTAFLLLLALCWPTFYTRPVLHHGPQHDPVHVREAR